MGDNTIYTCNGAGVTMWDGYCADMAKELVKHYPTWYWQPVGNWDTRPVPMKPGVTQGVAEVIRLMTEVHPTGKIILASFSEGAIIASMILDLLRDPKSPIAHRLKDVVAAIAIGNPRRQREHGFPGCIITSGMGIVEPNLIDTPDWWWDFANGDEIPGSGGEDLYATCSDAKGVALQNMRSIWKIVWDGNPTSLAWAITKAIFMPWRWGAAAVALAKAIKFFGAGTAPHVDYHVSYPIKDDHRDSWRIGFDYLADTMRRNP